MKKWTLLLGMLCLLSMTFAQHKNELTVSLKKEAPVRANPFLEEFEAKMTPHPTLPNVFIMEAIENEEETGKKSAKAAGCDAILTYVGHDNEWALIPESHLPQTFQFYGTVSNGGEEALTNVKLKVTVYNSANTSVFTATSDPVASLGVGEETEITIPTTYSFTVKDNYYIAYEAIHDCTEPGDNDYDNLLYRWVQISDNVMAKFTDNIQVKSSNFIFGEGNIGMLVKMDKDEILTGVSYKTYSAAVATTAKAAVYAVEVKDEVQVNELGEWQQRFDEDGNPVLDEDGYEVWDWVVTGEERIPYTNIISYELLARSDDGITYKFEALHDYYLPIDRVLNDPTIRGVKLEKDKYYVIASDGVTITTANTTEYNKQTVWGKSNAEGADPDFFVVLHGTLPMIRMHFGAEEQLQNTDVGIKEILTPKTTHAIPSMFSVKVNVKNYGKQAASGVKVYYQYNDEPAVEKTVDATIEPFQTLTVTFDDVLNLFEPEIATLKVWTSLAGDTNSANNELTSAIDLVNPNYNFNFELPDWNFYSWNANASRNRFTPWKTVDEDASPVKSIIVGNNYNVVFSSMGASFGGGNVGNSGRRSFQGITPSLTSPTLTDFVTPHGGRKIGWVASPAGQAKDWMISPKVKLNTNSSVELWAMALDGGTNEEKFKVLISTTDDALESFAPVSGDGEVTIPKEWTKFEYDLSEYDNKEVYVALYYCSNDQLFAAFDDILIKTDFVAFTDLEISGVTSPTIITDKSLTVTIKNNGNKPVEEGLTLSYKLDDGEPVTVPFDSYPINSGQSKEFTFPEEIDLAVGTYTFEIRTNYNDDNNSENDVFTYKVEINPLADPLKLTFEEFIDFSENFYPWTNLDVDGSLSYNLGTHLESMTYFKEWMPIGFIAFNSSATIPESTSRFPAYEGNKFGASIGVWNPTNVNNDWLISPKAEITEGFNYVTMMVRSSAASDLEHFNVLVSTTDTKTSSFTALNEEVLEAPGEWTEVAYQLNDFMDQGVHVAVQCVSTDGHVFMIDNLEIVLGEAEKTEAQVTEVLSPSTYPKLPFTDVPVKIRIANSGNQDVTPVSVSMQLNDGSVITETYEGEALAWKQSIEYEFTGKINLTEPGINILKAWVNYGDGTSEVLEQTIYINEPQNNMFIDFEDAYDFTTVLLPWSNIDVDGIPGITFNLTLEDQVSYPLIYPGYGEPQSFVVFNPSKITSVPNLTNYIKPKSGERIAMSVRLNEGNSNDWFISPKVSLLEGTSSISFFARGLVTGYNERFNVLVSTTDTDPASFTSISGASPVTHNSSAWTEYKYSLNDYNGQEVYVAIQCVTGSAGAMFMIDDVEISTSSVNIPESKNTGISISPNPTDGVLNIRSSNEIRDIEILNASGKLVLREKINSLYKTYNLTSFPSGLYLIRINTDMGVEVKKIIKK